MAVELSNNNEETLIARRYRAFLPLLERYCLDSLSAATRGALTVSMPSGRRHEIEGDGSAPKADLMFHHPAALWRLFSGGTMGFSEAYMDKLWDSSDLFNFLIWALQNRGHFERLEGGSRMVVQPSIWLNRIRYLLRRNTLSGSRRNIAAHYDLGNAFYKLWLDPSMTYSSALYNSEADSLEQAQKQKYRRIAESLGLRQDMRVLEIGCGWGGFACFAAAEYGCHVTGLTLSREQYDYAVEAVQKNGLNDRITIKLEDYRHCEGEFDRIVSIEMFEAVGMKNWPHYFDIIRNRLVDGGLANLQIISIDEGVFDYYLRNPDFIRIYIFPGGMLISPERLRQTIAEAGLNYVSDFVFSSSYTRTLKCWHESFCQAWPRIQSMGFDQHFRRMWEFYLLSCAAGFDSGDINVGQYLIKRS